MDNSSLAHLHVGEYTTKTPLGVGCKGYAVDRRFKESLRLGQYHAQFFVSSRFKTIFQVIKGGVCICHVLK